MRLLWFCLLLYATHYTEAKFGTPYLHSSRICKPWNCVSAKLGLSNVLPPQDEYRATLKSLLPPGPWQEVVDTVLYTCYNDRPRNYVSTCPGQALLHCTIDNLVANCPDENLRKDDGCYWVSSLAGTTHMFTQSRYADLEKNLPKEKRPAWFMRDYFNSKCCNLPDIVNSTVVKECGFSNLIHYYDHTPTVHAYGTTENVNFMVHNTDRYNTETYDTEKYNTEKYNTPKYNTEKHNTPKYNTEKYNTPKYNTEKYNTERYNTETYNTETSNTETSNTETYNTETYNTERYTSAKYNTERSTSAKYNTERSTTAKYRTERYEDTERYNTESYNTENNAEISTTESGNVDPVLLPEEPLHCCDMSDFVTDRTREECAFRPYWDDEKRLVVDPEAATTTTTKRPSIVYGPRDFKLVPLSCEKEQCLFQQLNIVSETGSVDTEAFSKLLDNFTSAHPLWNKAKARVITQCLSRGDHGYEASCEINKLLACTLDVLTENCPYATKNDACRHARKNFICQISSSRYRPKYRRSSCGLPNLVNNSVLTSCGVTSVSKIEYLPEPPQVSKADNWRNSIYACKDNEPVTTCVMERMGVLNKYRFMDYFRMKDKIRSFTRRHQEWSPFTDTYFNAVVETPAYTEYCTSTRKLLNVLDVMMRTCPLSRRKTTAECTAFFKTINAVTHQNATKTKIEQSRRHYVHMFYPHTTPVPHTTPSRRIIHTSRKTNHLFDFGILDSNNAPPVETLDLEKSKPIQVILPVYMRLRTNPLRFDTSTLAKNSDGVFRTTPYLLHGKIPTTNHEAPLIPPGLP